VLQPIASIQKLCALRNILLHVDVTHAIGKIPIDVQEMGIDYMTFNGEQFHAPKGIGGLIVKQGVPICPLIRGEGEDLYFRGGPLNVPMLVACKQALLEAEDQRTWYGTEVARLRSMLEQGVQQGYPEATILFQEEERLPHVSCMAFPGIYNEFFLYNLHKKGVFASIGGGSVQSIERVLVAGGVSSDLAKTAISFSLSKDTTEKEVERAIQIIVEHAKRLRKLSQKIV
jgi:cysteine desulfurase